MTADEVEARQRQQRQLQAELDQQVQDKKRQKVCAAVLWRPRGRWQAAVLRALDTFQHKHTCLANAGEGEAAAGAGGAAGGGAACS
jgi:hypothetical protein